MRITDRSAHRWYPLVREWERTMKAENKAPNTIAVYLDGVGQLIGWLDQLPAAATDDLASPADPADITKRHPAGQLGSRPGGSRAKGNTSR